MTFLVIVARWSSNWTSQRVSVCLCLFKYRKNPVSRWSSPVCYSSVFLELIICFPQFVCPRRSPPHRIPVFFLCFCVTRFYFLLCMIYIYNFGCLICLTKFRARFIGCSCSDMLLHTRDCQKLFPDMSPILLELCKAGHRSTCELDLNSTRHHLAYHFLYAITVDINFQILLLLIPVWIKDEISSSTICVRFHKSVN